MHPESRGIRSPEQARPADPEAAEYDQLPDTLTELSPHEATRRMEASLENPSLLHRLNREELRERIEEWEDMPEYRRFKHLHLNFETLDNAAEAFAGYAKERSHQLLAQELVRQVREIKIAVHRYYNSVMAFDRTSINKYRLERKEYLEELQRIDAKRRTDHNSLIDAALSLSRLCYRRIPEEAGYKFKKTELFDPHLIMDLQSDKQEIHRAAREKIANWAFLNERGAHISAALKHAQNALEERGNEKTALE
jgi:hypothetical protein